MTHKRPGLLASSGYLDPELVNFGVGLGNDWVKRGTMTIYGFFN